MFNKSAFQHKKVLITGGLGFIGSNLAIRLVSLGADVTLVDSLIPQYGGNLWNIEPIKGQVKVNISDVRDQYSMKYLVEGQDYMFNLAGQTSHLDSMEDPEADLEINAHAQLKILEVCRHYNPTIKLVFASTRQVYGKPAYIPVDEIHPVNPIDINGINKLAGEQYHLVYNNVYGVRASILLLTNTYGPRMRVKDSRQTFLGIWLRRLLEGQPITIFGDGEQTRDFIYVKDVAAANAHAALGDAAGVFNVAYGGRITINDLARRIIRLTGSRSEIRYLPERPGDVKHSMAAVERLKATGFVPSSDFDAGLAATIEFFAARQA